MRIISFLLILSCHAQDNIDEIMTKVASNLEEGSELRNSYVYTQKIHTRLLRTNSKLAREERREYTVTPEGNSTNKKLIHFDGQYQKGKKLIPYTEPGFRHKDLDIDGDLIEDLADSLIADKDSKDGIDMDLFPFLPKDLPKYKFKLLGTETYRGRPVHRISFAGLWGGEALIDVEDLHPISIQTKLNIKMPMAVKVMFGTNLRQTGFSLTYARIAPGLWFPATYGTEMRLDVLFGYKRVITMSMESSSFKKASTDSSVSFEDVK
jgi:hypothetical protein